MTPCIVLFAFRALQAGVRNPLLVLLPDSRFENTELVTLLGALEALYVVSKVWLLLPLNVQPEISR